MTSDRESNTSAGRVERVDASADDREAARAVVEAAAWALLVRRGIVLDPEMKSSLVEEVLKDPLVTARLFALPH